MMKHFYTLILLAFFFVPCFSQSYVIDHFQSDYDTLTDYRSVNLELYSELVYPLSHWEKTFDFDFDFSFFDSTYNQIIIDADGVAYFPGSEEYNVNLFAGFYSIAEIVDTSYLNSEVRYASTKINEKKALVVEYHNVYNGDELDENGANHTINFQMVFYENGIIELRFGEIDLRNCSYYFPEQGFSFDNMDPTDEIYGPWIVINNDDFTESACFSGDHSNPVILYNDIDAYNVLTSIPPPGYVVQFSPSDISSTIQSHSVDNKYWLLKNDGYLKIQGDMEDFLSFSLYDLSGRKIVHSADNYCRLGGYQSQIYVCMIERRGGWEVHKVFVE